MTNSVRHWQFLSSDPDRTAAFYGDLFDWPVSTANGMGYRTVSSSSGVGIDGGIWPTPPGGPEGVQIYVEVADIDATLARVRELGGTVVLEKQVLPDGDAMALAMDTLGRSFGLMTPASAGNHFVGSDGKSHD